MTKKKNKDHIDEWPLSHKPVFNFTPVERVRVNWYRVISWSLMGLVSAAIWIMFCKALTIIF